jgi:selenocysteine lyase/cysteine desulfurase
LTICIDEAEALSYRSQFPIFDRKIYLNSCSLGPLCRTSRVALEEYATDWEEWGAPAWWERWIPKIEAIKELFAQTVAAPTESVTIHHSMSSALTSVASAFDYSGRNRVVVSDLDFPTIAYQWLAKPGVEVVFAKSYDGVTVPLEEYERLIDERTILVATSHVFYATGAIQDIQSIASLAHSKGASIVVDGYHALGVFPVNASELGVDFYLGGTLKWLCGGPGLTFIYASPGRADLFASSAGWFSAQDQFAFDTLHYQPASSADRFQLGTPSVATVYSGIPGVSMILEVGPERIYARVQGLTGRVIEIAGSARVEVASPMDADSRGGVVMLRVNRPAAVVEALGDRNIVVDQRPGKVRISPHFYNTEADIESAMGALIEASKYVAA